MKLLLAFCEGDHDVIFVHRSARSLGGFVPFERSLQQYPAPLGAGQSAGPPIAQFLVRRVQRSRPEMETLDDALRPPLPALAGALHHGPTDTLLLLVRTHGMDQGGEVERFLDDLFLLLEVPSQDITACATAFFVDADDEDCGVRAQRIASSFGSPWGVATLSPGAWAAGRRGPLGAFVFCAPGATTGSLEDVLAPLVEAHLGAYFQAAGTFIDGHASPTARVRRAARHRLKAVITAAGQFDKPGNPMSEMIRWGFLPPQVFTTSAEAAQVASFLHAVPW